jgi:hypothetical protein
VTDKAALTARPLSVRVDRLASGVFLAVVVAAFVAATGGLVMVLRLPGGGSSGPSSIDTTVITYDVDGDGDPEFAKIDDRVRAVPADPGGGGGGAFTSWLQLVGTLGAALIGVLGTLLAKALKTVNRESGEKIETVEGRLTALEGALE